jgi:hypothetical protein
MALYFGAVTKGKLSHAAPKPLNKTTAHPIATSTVSWLQIPNVCNEGWDTLPEIKFWRRIVSLNKDSSAANYYEKRTLLRNFSKRVIDSIENLGNLDILREELRKEYNLPAGCRVMFTSGRSWFYNFKPVQLKIGRAMDIFDSLGVDPFYAQTVLLIESPASAKQKSFAGAYGHFQIMPNNARKYGLRVDKYIDERENFDRSAYVSAMLFRETFIPYAKIWCQQFGFTADENALWFKLLVMHCYNAGPYGVKTALQNVPNYYQNNALIRQLWHTTGTYFPSEAQNYSQLALACYLEFEKQLATNKVPNKIYQSK